MGNVVEKELAGVCSLGYMEKPLVDFVRSLRVTIEEQTRNAIGDSTLIGVLCEAARCAWELNDTIKRALNSIDPPTDEPWLRPGFYWWQQAGVLCYVERSDKLFEDTPEKASVSLLHTRVANRPGGDIVYAGQSINSILCDGSAGKFYPVNPPPGFKIVRRD